MDFKTKWEHKKNAKRAIYRLKRVRKSWLDKKFREE